jgi:MurNAc alpha-1-phosphate uridylyltransferase
MKAMILAAGRGERMRPLSDTIPKPLLEVGDKPLIFWHIERLAKNGFKEIVINIAHLGDMIKQKVGDGSRWGVTIKYSDEQKSGALESAGGIKKALDILGKSDFLVVNADIFCNYEFDVDYDLQGMLAHLIFVKNPPHNIDGDFGVRDSLALNSDDKMYTFSGIGYYSYKLFEDIELQKSPLAPLLRDAIEKKQVSAEVFKNIWHDIGTPKRLEEINEKYNTDIVV